MAQITLKGKLIHTSGVLPTIGSKAPAFTLTKTDLSDVSLKEFSGKNIILNIFPSIDTPVCATSVRTFNKEAAGRADTIVLCISADLPFAHIRFCGAEGISNVISLSEMRNRLFGDAYGVRITDGPLAGILSRAIVVIDKTGTVVYTEQVPEIAQEPDYATALGSLV